MNLQKGQESQAYKCDICNDQGFIFTNKKGYEIARKCQCKIKEEMISKHDNSGLAGLFKSKTFDNYIAKDQWQKTIKQKAVNYTAEAIRGSNKSFAILGQSGIGKTHIMIAIAGQLIKKNIEVKYYVADDIIQKLNALKFDEENYNIEFNKIANAKILFVDDLFKSSIKEFYQTETIDTSDLKVMFQLINYRYNKEKPILLSSEIDFKRFQKLDQALLGRINEMCNYEYLTTVAPDPNKNYRLRRD